MPPELASFADLAAYRAGDDETLLAQAQEAVRDHCGWHIAPERDEDLTLKGSGDCVLFLRSKHVTDVTAVTVDGVELAVGAYDWNEDGKIVRLAGRFSSRSTVVVSLVHGYAVTPPPVTQAVVELVEHAKATSQTPGVTSIRRGPFAETYGEAFSPATAMALGPYALPGFA